MKNLIFVVAIIFSLNLYCQEEKDDSVVFIPKKSIKIPKPEDGRFTGFRKNYRTPKDGGVSFSGKRFNWEKKREKRAEPEKSVEIKNSPAASKPVEKMELPGYYGEIRDEKRHGNGLLILENGDRYTGAWKFGKKEGNGIYIYKNGIKYVGQWENNMMHGEGSLIFPDGSKYMGEMKHNKITGKGTFTYSDGSTYEGEWKDGSWNGYGAYTLPDGRKHTGHFVNNQPVD